MDEQQIVGLVGQGTFAGALLLLLYKVGGKIVDALERLIAKLDEHTTKDLAAQAEVREDLAALSAKVDVIADVTPIRGVREPNPERRPR